MAGEIFIADKATLDAANTKLGANVDAGGTTTVFARLKQIYDYLVANLSTSRTAKIDNLDATISTRATATALTSLDTKVGIASPTIAGTTTVMNYLKKIDDKAAGGYLTGKTLYQGSYRGDYGSDPNQTSAQATTLLSISGNGIAKLRFTDGYSLSSVWVQITVDGVVMSWANWVQAGSIIGLYNSYGPSYVEVPFNSTFVLKTYVDIVAGGGSSVSNAWIWQYYI